MGEVVRVGYAYETGNTRMGWLGNGSYAYGNEAYAYGQKWDFSELLLCSFWSFQLSDVN
jgi:hypothetical protein